MFSPILTLLISLNAHLNKGHQNTRSIQIIYFLRLKARIQIKLQHLGVGPNTGRQVVSIGLFLFGFVSFFTLQHKNGGSFLF